MNIFLIILGVIFLISIITNIYLFFKYFKIRNEYWADKSDFQYNKGKVSMMEYHYRNFKKGQNPYTTLRKMADVLQDFYN